MKNTILLLLVLLSSLHMFGQQDKEVNLLVTDDTWGKEIIQIPFWFAPEIDYKGVEDIRFAQGWEDTESVGFWALVFAWDMNLEEKPNAAFYEDSLKCYLDGLMKVVNEDSTIVIPKTKATLLETKTKGGITTYKGTLETYDAFTTKAMITLQVNIESHYCDTAKIYMPLFKMSPKTMEHKIWEQLNSIRLQDTICNH